MPSTMPTKTTNLVTFNDKRGMSEVLLFLFMHYSEDETGAGAQVQISIEIMLQLFHQNEEQHEFQSIH